MPGQQSCWGDQPVERGELGVSIANEEAEPRRSLAKIDQEIARLLGSPRAGRMEGHAQDVHARALTSITNNTYKRFRTIVSAWKNSQAKTPLASAADHTAALSPTRRAGHF
ncbi:hypothetical protein [Nonomuraea sp. NPDC002799]